MSFQSPLSRRARAEEVAVEMERARALVEAERAHVQEMLDEARAAARGDRELAAEGSDIADPAVWLTSEAADDAVAAGLSERLLAVERAEARLSSGTFGRSTLSGRQIPDERLEADPTAELTVDEAQAASGEA